MTSTTDLRDADKVRVLLDTSKCRAYGICVGLAPEVFDLPKGSPVAVLRTEAVEETDREDLEEAVFNCPAQAIALSPAQGQS